MSKKGRHNVNRILRRKEKGFTLIEILIAIALLAILGAVVVPNITGYMTRGGEQAYKNDQKAIQAAVDAYYSDPANRVSAATANRGKKQYPLKGSETQRTTGGTPLTGVYPLWASGAGFFIDLTALVTAKHLSAEPTSASQDNTTGATGSYSWYVKADGKVESKWVADASTVGPASGVYP